MLPTTVVRAVGSLPDVSRSGRAVNGLFRLMKCPLLWEQAYQKIAPNKGAMTPGVDGRTFDGFSPEKVRSIIDRLADGSYRPQPVRRIYIPKADGRMRPLGIPTTEDRLVQEVVRMLLDQIYEPVFSDKSHGFRPGRSCHTALKEIHAVWTGIKWLVDVDVVGFFDNIDHAILLDLLKKRIADRRFLALIRGMLKAGYLEDWRYHRTLSGTPQGGVVSPLLANVYLHELDEFMEQRIASFDRGARRTKTREAAKLGRQIHALRHRIDRLRASGDGDPERIASCFEEIGRLDAERRAIPATEAFDAGYRRLRYCRYADDFLIGVIGSKAEARQIMDEVRTFLATRLKLAVSEAKSGIAHAADGARFLGHDICTVTSDKPHRATFGGRRFLRRPLADRVQLHVPREKVARFVARKGWGDFETCTPTDRPAMLHSSDLEILLAYNAELRGFANYYALANDVKRKLNKAEYLAVGSFLRTLANKHKRSTTQIARQLRCDRDLAVRYEVQGRSRLAKLWRLKELERTVRRYGSVEAEPRTPYVFRRTELVERLNARICERCGSIGDPCDVHHVRKLSDMKKHDLLSTMRAARTRKRIVLCEKCHSMVHSYRPNARTPLK